MSGILDNKSRVLDTFITEEGRAQIASGKLRIAFAHFTDAAIVYGADAASGSDDATSRFYLESSNLPQDQITFEADDSGKLKPFASDSSLQLYAGQLLSSSFLATVSAFVTGSNETLGTLKDVAFASQIEGILTSSLDNIQKLFILGTNDKFSDDGLFAFGPTQLGFSLSSTKPLKKTTARTNVNYLEGLFSDPRFSNLENFKYLPPVNKIEDQTINKTDIRSLSSFLLGDYPAIGTVVPLGGRDVMRELKTYEALGFMKTIMFDPTSKNNNIAAQFFETNSDVAKKLDVIDFGRALTDDGVKHIFFVGKVMIDNYGVQKFVHVFTLVFE